MLFSLLPFFSGVLQGTSLELLLPFLAASHVLCYWLQPWLWWVRWIPKSSGWLLSNTIKTLPHAILFHLEVAVYLENLCTRYQKLLTSNFSPFLFCPPFSPLFLQGAVFCKYKLHFKSFFSTIGLFAALQNVSRLLREKDQACLFVFL